MSTFKNFFNHRQKVVKLNQSGAFQKFNFNFGCFLSGKTIYFSVLCLERHIFFGCGRWEIDEKNRHLPTGDGRLTRIYLISQREMGDLNPCFTPSTNLSENRRHFNKNPAQPKNVSQGNMCVCVCRRGGEEWSSKFWKLHKQTGIPPNEERGLEIL